MSEKGTSRTRSTLIGVGVGVVILAILAGEVIYTQPVREAVHAYTELLAAANRRDISPDQRLTDARRLCSRRYLQTHDLRLAPEGGFVGIPRGIHKNYQAWRHHGNVWICPTNRVGPIYQFVRESGSWRFDGPVGLLQPHWEVVPYVDTPEEPIDEL